MNIDLTMFEGIISPEEMDEIKKLDFGKLENLESKQEKWEKDREGCFSGSEFHRLMTDEDSRELSKGAQTYVIEKVLQTETIQEGGGKKINSASVSWGNETEIEAVLEFMKRTGKVVFNFGEDQVFVKASKNVGATPDGLIEEEEGIEVKCPDSKTHYERLRFLNKENFKEKEKQYYWQIQGCMYVTGRKRWYFVDFDPRFKNEEKRMLIIVIDRNEEDITKLKRKLFLANKDYTEQLKYLRN